MTTAIITSDTSIDHVTGNGHPEQIARISVTLENFKKLNNKNLIWKKSTKVDNSILKTAHDSNYIDFVQNSFPKNCSDSSYLFHKIRWLQIQKDFL